MRNHGPFTIGKDARAAVKSAVLVEEIARTVHISRQLGEPLPIAQSDIDSRTRATRTSTDSASERSQPLGRSR
jgi:ribulose-5-phosphate 4-epimerase/fuculose-1-phosphate aldolase